LEGNERSREPDEAERVETSRDRGEDGNEYERPGERRERRDLGSGRGWD
jgi:hypothetical protein